VRQVSNRQRRGRGPDPPAQGLTLPRGWWGQVFRICLKAAYDIRKRPHS